MPNGWRVTSSSPSGLQIANGTAAGDGASEPGTAKAVFDLYFDASHTRESYEELLRSGNARYSVRERRYGGAEAVVFSYAGAEFAGRQEAVLFPDHRVLVVYRAAFPHDDDAFSAGLDGFHTALESIRFVQSPRRPAA